MTVMAKRRDLEISFAPDGEVTVKVEGFPGKGCLEVFKLLEAQLGPIQSQRFTSEYYEPDQPVNLRVRH